MKRLTASTYESTTNGFPVKGGVWEILQDGPKEAIAAAVINLIGSTYDTSKVYILYGCVNRGSGSNYVISEGAVFYNGEVYYVDAATLTTSGSNVVVGSIDTSYISATNSDPVTFTDGVARNVHEIRKVLLGLGLSGSGIANYTAFVKAGSLPLFNTDTFVPTTDYQPSTKKYADETSGMKLLWVGNISANGATITKAGPSNTSTVISAVSKLATGTYRATHNIGHTNFFVNGRGLDTSGSVKYLGAVINKTTTTFDYYTSTDGSLADAQVELSVIKFY